MGVFYLNKETCLQFKLKLLLNFPGMSKTVNDLDDETTPANAGVDIEGTKPVIAPESMEVDDYIGDQNEPKDQDKNSDDKNQTSSKGKKRKMDDDEEVKLEVETENTTEEVNPKKKKRVDSDDTLEGFLAERKLPAFECDYSGAEFQDLKDLESFQKAVTSKLNEKYPSLDEKHMDALAALLYKVYCSTSAAAAAAVDAAVDDAADDAADDADVADVADAADAADAADVTDAAAATAAAADAAADVAADAASPAAASPSAAAAVVVSKTSA